jgi:hypothetical protein
VKDDDGPCPHELFYLLLVTEEELLYLLWIIDVNCSLYMPTLEFIVETAVNDDMWAVTLK